MAQHLFSSALLHVYPSPTFVGSAPTAGLSGAPLTATRVNNSGTVYAADTANLVDGNTGTGASIRSHLAASPETSNDWFVIDTGAPYSIVTVNLILSSDAFNATNFKVWTANDYTLKPGDPGTTPFATASFGPGSGPHTFGLTPATPIQDRYLLLELICATPQTVHINDVSCTVLDGMEFAAIQDANPTNAFSRKEAYGPAFVSLYPIAYADSNGKIEVKMSNLEIRADTLQQLIGCVLTNSAGPPSIDTLLVDGTVPLPDFAAVIHFEGTDGGAMEIYLPSAVSMGPTIPYKINDFAIPSFTLCGYPDKYGVSEQFFFYS